LASTGVWANGLPSTQSVVSDLLVSEGIRGSPSLSIEETPARINVNVSLLQKTKDGPAAIAKLAADGIHTLHPTKKVTVKISSYGLDRGFHYVLVDRKEAVADPQAAAPAPVIKVPEIHP